MRSRELYKSICWLTFIDIQKVMTWSIKYLKGILFELVFSLIETIDQLINPKNQKIFFNKSSN
jgi:hypothetical protein